MNASDQLVEDCRSLCDYSRSLRDRSAELYTRLALLDRRCHAAQAEAQRLAQEATDEHASE